MGDTMSNTDETKIKGRLGVLVLRNVLLITHKSDGTRGDSYNF